MSAVMPLGAPRRRLVSGSWTLWLLLAIVAALVLYPILQLLLESVRVGAHGAGPRFSLDHWRDVFGEPRIGEAIVNTLSLSLARESISLLVGVFIAWLIARTNLPGRKWMEVGFWVALFMPHLPVTLAWVLLLGGTNGLINKAIMSAFSIETGFSIYSWWGIVWVHLVTSTIAIKVFLLVPAFKAIDSSLEEAARMSGANIFSTFVRVVIPMMMPAILVVAIVGAVRAMQAFDVELILGAPMGLEVYSTVIYNAMTQEPPLNGMASGLSILFLVGLLPIIWLQQHYSQKRTYSTISGKFAHRVQNLGSWRWPLFAAIAVMLALMTIVPIIFLLLSTFMKIFGIFDLQNPWTLDNWRAALFRGDALSALWNTLRIGVSAALAGTLLFTVLAYASLWWESRGRRLLDFLTWIPTLVPGVVLSLGLLLMFTGVPVLRPLYGTITILVIAVIIGTITIGTQLLKASLRQVGKELQEAGRANGGALFYTIRRIVLPLVAPSLAVVALEIFAAANTAVGIVSLLGTGDTQPMSLLQLNLMTAGQFEAAAVVGVLVTILTIGSALLARYIGSRAGLGRYGQ